MDRLTTVRHPRSGEVYAVRLDYAGLPVEAAGPLWHGDPIDQDSLEMALANNQDSREDGAWLARELGYRPVER